MTPTVPFTSPNSIGERPSPPLLGCACRKSCDTGVSNASGRRNSSMKAMASSICFFWKNVAKVVQNSVISSPAVRFSSWLMSSLGCGRM